MRMVRADSAEDPEQRACIYVQYFKPVFRHHFKAFKIRTQKMDPGTTLKMLETTEDN